MLKIDYEVVNEGQWKCRYKKLPQSGDDHNDKAAARRRRLWLKKLNGRVKGVKLSRYTRKLNWKPFSIMYILSRKIARKYVDFVKRMKMEEACPAIVFSCQWGLPVLSHSSHNTTKNLTSYYKNLTWVHSQYAHS